MNTRRTNNMACYRNEWIFQYPGEAEWHLNWRPNWLDMWTLPQTYDVDTIENATALIDQLIDEAVTARNYVRTATFDASGDDFPRNIEYYYP